MNEAQTLTKIQAATLLILEPLELHIWPFGKGVLNLAILLYFKKLGTNIIRYNFVFTMTAFSGGLCPLCRRVRLELLRCRRRRRGGSRGG